MMNVEESYGTTAATMATSSSSRPVSTPPAFNTASLYDDDNHRPQTQISTVKPNEIPLDTRNFYVVSALKATSVNASIVCQFISPKITNLILSKSNRLELYSVTENGLTGIANIDVFGQIETLECYRVANKGSDNVIITTSRDEFAVLQWSEPTSSIVVVAKGEYSQRYMRTNRPEKMLTIVDPKSSVFAIYAFNRYLSIYSVADGKGSLAPQSYDFLLDVSPVAITFAHCYPVETFYMLCNTVRANPSNGNNDNSYRTTCKDIKAFSITKDRELKEVPTFRAGTIDARATHLVAVAAPYGGALVISEENVAYISGNGKNLMVNKTPSIVRCFCTVDPTRYLLADFDGQLWIVLLIHDSKTILSLSIEKLGITSIAHCMSYIDNGIVFIGSAFGDSQLIRLLTEPLEDGSSVEILEQYPNVGSIVDMTIINREQGISDLITCSGGFKDGSLRLIRNAMGITEEANIELPGMEGIWSLKSSSYSDFDKYLVESFVEETRILAFEDEELGEIESSGFDSGSRTLYCANISNDLIVQCTTQRIRLIRCNSLEYVDEWIPLLNGVNVGPISTAIVKNDLVLFTTSGAHHLFLLRLENNRFTIVNTKPLENDVSCIDMGDTFTNTAHLAVISEWNSLCLRILQIPSLQELTVESLGGDVISRSALIVRLDSLHIHLLCGLGDGQLLDYILNPSNGALSQRKLIAVGTQSLSLSKFSSTSSSSEQNVFISCDRPTIVSSSSGRLVYSRVNLGQVNFMAPFHTPTFEHCMAFASLTHLLITRTVPSQKIHIQTVPLHGQPRRIAHLRMNQVVVVLFLKYDGGKFFGETHSYVQLRDETSMELLQEVKLLNLEEVSSITTFVYPPTNTEYIVVGTAFVRPEEEEPTKGRIILYKVQDKRLHEESVLSVRGAVYTMDIMTVPNGIRIVAGVNGRFVVISPYKNNEGTQDLGLSVLLTQRSRGVVIQSLFCQGNYIISADLMSLIDYYYYVEADGKFSLEEVAVCMGNRWMSTIAPVHEKLLLGADFQGNLFSLRRGSNENPDDMASIDIFGRFGLGDVINRIIPGSLVSRLTEVEKNPSLQDGSHSTDMDISSSSSSSASTNTQDGDYETEPRITPTHVIGTIRGMVGVLAPLSAPQAAFLTALEAELQEKTFSIGKFSHQKWRSFQASEEVWLPAQHFVDGDLIEGFLNLPQSMQEKIATKLNISLEKLIGRIDDLTRIH